ncbi:thioesterase II family protein [Kitasatospora phosalacinea]|uniref:PhpM n=1 Tax=Kitasatospora phosalacinea TaxID=2065 RepID=A0A0M3WPQ7_9ACTN|nr:alpha/beta fold hydrolase [Kitasatospora phosalacinea]AKO69619.1 PhpM [Kitasatospora phosalacinea]
MNPGRWLRRLRRDDRPALRLLCFPHAGAGAGVFQPWGRLCPDRTELWAVRYPGREDRLAEPFATDLAELADHAAGAAATLTDVPLVLFGHSMGAVLAYEVALRLEAAGAGQLHGLVLSAGDGPGGGPPAGLHLLSDDDLVGRTARMGVQPYAEAYRDPELREILLPVLRDDCRLLESHPRPVPPARVHVPVLACAGLDDPACPPAAMASWEAVAAGGFRLREFPGSHFHPFDRPDRVLAAVLSTFPVPRRGPAAPAPDRATP